MLSAFVEEAADRLASADEIADFVPSYFRGTGARNRNIGVDGYAFDESDNCMRLLIGSWSGAKAAPTLTQADATRLFGIARGFIEDSFARRLDEIEASAASPRNLFRFSTPNGNK